MAKKAKEFISSDLHIQDNFVCDWTNAMDDTLVDAYYHEDALEHKVGGTCTTHAIDNIVKELRSKFLDKSGMNEFTWDPITHKWDAEPEVWDQLIQGDQSQATKDVPTPNVYSEAQTPSKNKKSKHNHLEGMTCMLKSDGYRTFTSYHIDILLTILHSKGCDAEKRSDDGIALNEQIKVSHKRLGEICLDLFHNLLSHHALFDLVGESLVEKILTIENGIFAYNDLTLGLLAHVVVCLVDSSGCNLRTKIYNIFANFMREKAKTICSECPNLKKFLEILPSLFHIEILLINDGASEKSLVTSSQEKDSRNKGKFLSEFHLDVPIDTPSLSLTEFSTYDLLEEKL
ncbi:hypothetical protein FXO38_02761 [Capsicum annuum]|nr:hypothetical protein FXO38_02761 [Capsicum annuum]KAF3681571.1 hypothetical protein FXO37_02851 [Capsicum annuum]